MSTTVNKIEIQMVGRVVFDFWLKPWWWFSKIETSKFSITLQNSQCLKFSFLHQYLRSNFRHSQGYNFVQMMVKIYTIFLVVFLQILFDCDITLNQFDFWYTYTNNVFSVKILLSSRTENIQFKFSNAKKLFSKS